MIVVAGEALIDLIAGADGALTAVPGDGVLVQTCVSSAAGTCQIDH